MKSILLIIFSLLVGCSSPSIENYRKLETPDLRTDKPVATSVKSQPTTVVLPEKSLPTNTIVIDGDSTVSTSTQQQVFSQLHSANIAYSIPSSMNIKDSVKIQVLIDSKQGMTELLNSLSVDGEKSSKKIKIAKVIIAKITAPDFEVNNITPEEQAISETDSTEWLWSLEPKSVGKHEINLSITAVVNVDGQSRVHHIKTYESKITVEVTAKQMTFEWISKYWQWVFSTMLLPLGLWMWKKKIEPKLEN